MCNISVEVILGITTVGPVKQYENIEVKQW